MKSWERAIVRVWQGKPKEGGKYCGSAFLIAPDRLLTAKHVVEVSQMDILLMGPSWSGIRRIKEVVHHPDRDLSLLILHESDARTSFIPLGEEGPRKDEYITIAGYSTEDQDLESPSLQVQSYDGENNAFVTHTFVGTGMSGGPVIRQDKLVGLAYARDLDRDRTYIIPLGAFKDFLRQHLGGHLPQQPKPSPEMIQKERLTFLSAVKKEIERQLNRKPLSDLKMALKGDGDFFQMLSKIEDDTTINKKYFERFAIQFKDGFKASIEKMRDDSRSDVVWKSFRDGTQAIFGWLCMLSVRDGKGPVAKGILNKDNIEFKFTVPVKDMAVVNIVTSRRDKRPPRFEEGNKAIDGNVHISSSVELGASTDAIVSKIQEIIWKQLNRGSPDSDFSTHILKEDLRYREENKKYSYLTVPLHEEGNALHDPEVLQKLHEALKPFLKFIFTGAKGEPEVLWTTERWLINLINEFSKLLEETYGNA